MSEDVLDGVLVLDVFLRLDEANRRASDGDKRAVVASAADAVLSEPWDGYHRWDVVASPVPDKAHQPARGRGAVVRPVRRAACLPRCAGRVDPKLMQRHLVVYRRVSADDVAVEHRFQTHVGKVPGVLLGQSLGAQQALLLAGKGDEG